MGKPIGKKTKAEVSKQVDTQSKQAKALERNSKSFDEDTAIFIIMSQELKDEGNKLLQRRDHEGAMLKYEKAVKLLPKNHIDVASLRTNMASCYMQMGFGEYPRAISECNMALEVAPKYSKALLKRARCFDALNRFDLAWRDVSVVLNMEPNNQTALDIADSLRKAMEEKGIKVDEIDINAASEYLASSGGSSSQKVVKEKKMRKKSKKKKKSMKVEEKKTSKLEETSKIEEKRTAKMEETPQIKEKKTAKMEETPKIEETEKTLETCKEENVDDKLKPEDKEVVQEKIRVKEDRAVFRTVKLVFGDDIRWARLPISCDVLLMRDVVRDRFPNLKGALVKYRDQEDDLITITTTKELRKAEASVDSQGSLRLHIVEVEPDQEPVYEGSENEEVVKKTIRKGDGPKKEHAGNADEVKKASTCVENWVVQFSQLFKNHVGFDSDAYLDLHELGMKLYSEAMEDTLSSEEAQDLFDIASEKFQEMAALALFNWGNVHMAKARKGVVLSENYSSEMIISQLRTAYEWAKKEYTKAATRYEEAVKVKPDFYEGRLALGQQQFEQARLCWSYAGNGSKVDEEAGAASEVLQLYNRAEDSMEAGMQIWEEIEEQRLNGLSKEDMYKSKLKKMGLDGLLNDISAEEALEQAAIMRSQIYILWGTILYERSIVEFKLGLPSWEECLEVAVEKFELAGATHTDIGVMVKNHCANHNAQEGFGFKIDEIVQAWNEMYDAKRWQLGIPSFRLEPLFRRRVPRLHQLLEHV